MGIERRGRAVREVRTLMHLGAVGGWTDGQLLERYLGGGEAAECSFAALVDRHGPMVLRVCRSILGDGPDAHDAFQATFLVLVRRAGSLCVRDSVGPWLYQVSWRVSRCARLGEARRRRHERRAAEQRATWEDVPMPDPDLGAILLEELARLPERYRVPLVLCDLEGNPHELAARHLGCAVGTIKSRLSRGRDRLRARLARRGLAPTAVLFATPTTRWARATMPSSLLESTIRLAVRRAAGGVVPVSVAGLANGALRVMFIEHIRILAIGGLTAAAMATGVAVTAQVEGDDPGVGVSAARSTQERPEEVETPSVDAPRVGDLAIHEVRSGPLRRAVVTRGNLQSASTKIGRSEVEGERTLLMILPEGTKVVKDQLVCELDDSDLRDRLADQQVITGRARAGYEGARLAVEVGESRRSEYEEGIYPREFEAIQGEIELATSRLDLERARLGALEAAGATELERKAGEIVVQKAELALARVEDSKELLARYTRSRKSEELRAEIEKARIALKAEESALILEQEKEERLNRMIEQCKIYAPGPGMVIYADSPTTTIEEGVTVRERQELFRLPDLSRMQVNALVPEAWVDQVALDMPVEIKVDAFPGRTMSGKVVEVNGFPDRTVLHRQGIKVYPTLIEIADGERGLRPGMTAEVEIVLAERDDVVTVPARALLHEGDAIRVAVEAPGGGVEWREVALGISDGKELVEVKQGLRAGDRVVLDPAALRGEEGRRAGGLGRPSPPDGADVP